MKANEIMIGGWVYMSIYNQITKSVKNKDFRVSEVKYIGNTLYAFNRGDGCITTVENLEPIPLTQEILEKNGWADHRDLFIDSDFNIALEKYYGPSEDTFWWHLCGFPVVKISYVHQLQMVLLINGIEKEIEL